MTGLREDPPDCFGKQWDPKEKECAGGMDPAFTDENGSHVRQRCLFFDSCGSRLQASRMESARGLLDPRSIVRKDVPVLGPSRPVGPAVQQQPTQAAAFVERFTQSVQQAAMQPYVSQGLPQNNGRAIHLPPQAPPPMGQVNYQQMMPVNYQMPGYLSVPETWVPGQSFWSYLGRTVFRSMGKSLGHSIAHLFDTAQLAPPMPPPVNVSFRNEG